MREGYELPRDLTAEGVRRINAARGLVDYEEIARHPLMTLDLGLPAQIRAAIELLGLPNYNGSPALIEQAEKFVSDYLSEK